MSIQVQGIIVAYEAMFGVILIRHKTWPSLASLAEEYEISKADKKYWFAKFRWSDIQEANRIAISHEQSLPTVGRPKKKKAAKRRLIRDIVVGCPVTCLVSKNPKWVATSVAIELYGSKFRLPARRYVRTTGGNNSGKKENVAEKRIDGLRRSGPSNLWCPWGGFH